MKVQFVDADQRIVSLASSVEADPRSWLGWSVLHISMGRKDGRNYQDSLFPAKIISAAYFNNVEGRAYFCNWNDIFIVCKNIDHAILKEAGDEIQKRTRVETGVSCEWRYFDLYANSKDFADCVYNSIGEKFSIHVETVNPATNSDFSGKSAETSKIMIVEDDPVIRWMLENALKPECEVKSVDCGNKVFSLYPSFNPKIVFLDIGLPDSDGGTVLDWIIRNDPSACVIMLSGKGDVDTITDSIAAGAKAFITKPVTKEDLMSYVHKYG